MVHTLRPLSLGALLDETFSIYRRNFLLFVGISAIPNVVFLMLQLAGSFIIGIQPAGSLAALAALSSALASLFVSSIVTAATTLGVSDIYLDTPTSLAACFSRIAPKAVRVCYVSFIVGLIVGLGSFLCIIPGIYWAGVYGVAIPAVVLENITGNESLRRTRALTEGSVGRVIIVYFLTIIFSVVMVFALNAAATVLGSTVFHRTGAVTDVLQQIFATLSEILFGPVSAIALTLVYYDQRVRKEAFDIEHMMSLMGVPNNLAASGTSAP